MAVAKMNAIFGMALGYKSYAILVFTLAANTYVAFSPYDLYDIAPAALGMLSTLATGLTVDGFGRISDNASGIAELPEFPSGVRDCTGALDSAGNTTAAIGKGFAIGSAALMPLALCGAFVARFKGLHVAVNLSGVNILEPITFVCFAALTMKSMGKAAAGMVQEVKCQFSLTDSKGKIDDFGPISDNAGGIAELPEFPSGVRVRTDALDAAGNTTAAIGKGFAVGFAVGSAELVSLALYGAFVVRFKGLHVAVNLSGVSVLQPITFAFLLVGAMVPYRFAALAMESMGRATGERVQEVRRQLSLMGSTGKTILSGGTEIKPGYSHCITISAKSSLREMIAPVLWSSAPR